MAGALYQKYRPNSFEEVFGESHIVKALSNAVKTKQISHAYIFSGPRGIGKTTIAKILAKVINCLDNKNGDACNACKNCIKINTQQTMDIVEMDAASNNGVAEIRQLIDNINYLPTDLAKKVYILDEAHMLTTGAWNALLKTLEECPEHIVFIFATTEYYKIPLTIVSRCQCFSFKRLSVDILSDLMIKIAEKEKIKISKEAINKLAYLADGSARDAVSSLDQVRSYSTSKTIQIEDIDSIFGLLDDNKKVIFINQLADGDLENAINTIDSYESEGVNFGQLIQDTFSIFIDLYLKYKTNGKTQPKSLNSDQLKKITMSCEQALVFAEIWEDLTGKIKHNQNIKYNLELAIFQGINKISSNSKNKNITKLADASLFEEKPKKEKPISEENKTINNADHEDSQNKAEDNNLSTKELNNFIDNSLNKKTSKKKNNENEDQLSTNDLEQNLKNSDLKNSKTYSKEEEIFLRIAIDNDQELIKSYQSILDMLKEKKWFMNKPLSSMIIDAKKVMIASNKGMVLLFDDEDQSILLNLENSKDNFIEFVNELFGSPLLIMGVTKKIAKDLTNTFIHAKKNNEIKDLNSNYFAKLIISKKSTKEIALEYFGDDLKIEDSER